MYQEQPDVQSLPLGSQNWSIYARPNFHYTIRHNTGVVCEATRRGNTSKFELSECPNMVFAKAVDTNVSIYHLLEMYSIIYTDTRPLFARSIFFVPALKDEYETNRISQAKKSFIMEAEQRAFVDKVLLPSIRQVQDTSRFSVCLDFANAARNSVGHALNKMVTEDLQSLIDAMRRAIRANNLIGFDDFFSVLYSHGIKVHIPMPIPAGHNGSLVEYGLRHQHIDFTMVDHFNLYVDLALSFKPAQHHPEGVTDLWANYENLLGCFFDRDPSPIRSVQAYGTWKTAFFRRVAGSNRQGKDFQPQDIFDGNTKFQQLYEQLVVDNQTLLDQDPNLAARLEFRIVSTFADQFLEKLQDIDSTLRPVYESIEWHCTNSLFSLTLTRLRALYSRRGRSLALLNLVQRSVEFASASLLLAFLMSTIYHREMINETKWRQVQNALNRRRTSDSNLLLLCDLVDPDILSFNHNFDRSILEKHFGRQFTDSLPTSISIVIINAMTFDIATIKNQCLDTIICRTANSTRLLF